MNPASATLRTTDRARRAWYLRRLSWALQDYPGRERRRVLADLRAEIDAAAADVGTAQALADLGRPQMLAERYLADVDRPLPRWNTGAVAAAVAVAALVYLGAAYAIGTLDTLTALGGGTRTAHVLGTDVVFTSTEHELAVTGALTWQGLALHAAVGLLAFVLAARLWRVLPQRPARTRPAAGRTA